MAVTVGVRIGANDERIYFLVVNGMALETSFSGTEGLRQALAEAYEIEMQEALSQIENLDLAPYIDLLQSGQHLTIATSDQPILAFSFVDNVGVFSSESFETLDDLLNNHQNMTSGWKK